jgi:hypothetical protein
MSKHWSKKPHSKTKPNKQQQNKKNDEQKDREPPSTQSPKHQIAKLGVHAPNKINPKSTFLFDTSISVSKLNWFKQQFPTFTFGYHRKLKPVSNHPGLRGLREIYRSLIYEAASSDAPHVISLDPGKGHDKLGHIVHCCQPKITAKDILRNQSINSTTVTKCTHTIEQCIISPCCTTKISNQPFNIMMIHNIYYFNRGEICALFKRNAKLKRIYGVAHKFNTESGTRKHQFFGDEGFYHRGTARQENNKSSKVVMKVSGDSILYEHDASEWLIKGPNTFFRHGVKICWSILMETEYAYQFIISRAPKNLQPVYCDANYDYDEDKEEKKEKFDSIVSSIATKSTFTTINDYTNGKILSKIDRECDKQDIKLNDDMLCSAMNHVSLVKDKNLNDIRSSQAMQASNSDKINNIIKNKHVSGWKWFFKNVPLSELLYIKLKPLYDQFQSLPLLQQIILLFCIYKFMPHLFRWIKYNMNGYIIQPIARKILAMFQRPPPPISAKQLNKSMLASAQEPPMEWCVRKQSRRKYANSNNIKTSLSEIISNPLRKYEDKINSTYESFKKKMSFFYVYPSQRQLLREKLMENQMVADIHNKYMKNKSFIKNYVQDYLTNHPKLTNDTSRYYNKFKHFMYSTGEYIKETYKSNIKYNKENIEILNGNIRCFVDHNPRVGKMYNKLNSIFKYYKHRAIKALEHLAQINKNDRQVARYDTATCEQTVKILPLQYIVGQKIPLARISSGLRKSYTCAKAIGVCDYQYNVFHVIQNGLAAVRGLWNNSHYILITYLFGLGLKWLFKPKNKYKYGRVTRQDRYLAARCHGIPENNYDYLIVQPEITDKHKNSKHKEYFTVPTKLFTKDCHLTRKPLYHCYGCVFPIKLVTGGTCIHNEFETVCKRIMWDVYRDPKYKSNLNKEIFTEWYNWGLKYFDHYTEVEQVQLWSVERYADKLLPIKRQETLKHYAFSINLYLTNAFDFCLPADTFLKTEALAIETFDKAVRAVNGPPDNIKPLLGPFCKQFSNQLRRVYCETYSIADHLPKYSMFIYGSGYNKWQVGKIYERCYAYLAQWTTDPAHLVVDFSRFDLHWTFEHFKYQFQIMLKLVQSNEVIRQWMMQSWRSGKTTTGIRWARKGMRLTGYNETASGNTVVGIETFKFVLHKTFENKTHDELMNLPLRGLFLGDDGDIITTPEIATKISSTLDYWYSSLGWSIKAELTTSYTNSFCSMIAIPGVISKDGEENPGILMINFPAKILLKFGWTQYKGSTPVRWKQLAYLNALCLGSKENDIVPFLESFRRRMLFLIQEEIKTIQDAKNIKFKENFDRYCEYLVKQNELQFKFVKSSFIDYAQANEDTYDYLSRRYHLTENDVSELSYYFANIPDLNTKIDIDHYPGTLLQNLIEADLYKMDDYYSSYSAYTVTDLDSL